MLDFLRKYQRFFFIAITVVIVISFSLFGAYNAFQGSSKAPEDITSYTTASGLEVSRLDLKGMEVLINSSQDPAALLGRRPFSPFSDTFIENELIATGLADEIVDQYWAKISSEAEEKSKAESKYQPYVHPGITFLSMETVWNAFNPELKAAFEAYKNAKGVKEKFKAKLRLYAKERSFPPELVKQILMHQERQAYWLSKDPALAEKDLALFGYRTFEDWFGSTFLRLISEYVIETALYGKDKGIEIADSEVESYLAYRANQALEAMKKQGMDPDVTVAFFVERSLQTIAADRAKAIAILKDKLLFEKTLAAYANANFIDPKPFKEYVAEASECAELERYTLSQELQFNKLDRLYLFQAYLHAISGVNPLKTELPESLYSPDKVAEVNPELVERRFKVEIASLSQGELLSKISLKEVWDFEESTAGWEILSQKFPDLKEVKAQDEEARLNKLQSMPAKLRAKIDAYCREYISHTRPNWIQEELAKKAKESKEITLSLGKVAAKDLVGISDSGALAKELESKKELSFYTQDGQNFYFIKVNQAHDPSIVSFKGASDEALKVVLERLTADFKKSLGDEKDLYAKYFLPLFKEIENEYLVIAKPKKNPTFDESFWLSHRFYSYMHHKLQEAKSEKEENLQGLMLQWGLIKERLDVRRGEDLSSFAFREPVGSFSQVKELPMGPVFFKILKVTQSASDLAKLTVELQKKVGLNAKNELGLIILQLCDLK